MKSAFTIALLMLLTLPVAALEGDEPVVPVMETDANGELQVVMQVPDDADGEVLVALYASEQDFLRKPLRNAKVIPENGRAEWRVEELPAGVYAVSAYLDANGNGELDSAWYGKPQEPIGTSNDARGSFGPPEFEDARFDFDGSELEVQFELVQP